MRARACVFLPARVPMAEPLNVFTCVCACVCTNCALMIVAKVSSAYFFEVVLHRICAPVTKDL